jgi:hypothetical protein
VKGFRKSTREREIIGSGPSTIEIGIWPEEYPKDLHGNKGINMVFGCAID